MTPDGGVCAATCDLAPESRNTFSAALAASSAAASRAASLSRSRLIKGWGGWRVVRFPGADAP